MEQYGKKVRFFVYNSSNLNQLDAFSSNSGINVMIINMQAFNTSMKEGGKSKEARIIYDKRDEFGSRRPIDVIKANNPIIILDEPFSGLDPVNAMLLKDLVRELIAKGRIVLFSSHQMNYIEEFCDDIAILNGGKIVLSGDIGEIKRSFDRRTILLSGKELQKIDAILTAQALPFVSAHEITDGKVAVTLRAPQDKEALYKALEPLAGSVDAFVVKEPTLNEIFVHYTEGAI